MNNIRALGTRPWLWSFVAAVLVWLTILAISGQGGGQTVSLALSLAPYLVVVGLGQMLVITAGPGNIDVSVAPVISLAGFVSVAAAASTGSAVAGVAAGVGVGLAVAAVSTVAILGLSVPPIIATLAAGLVASSATLSLADGFAAVPDPGLRQLLNVRPAGVPLLAVAVAAVTALVIAVLRRTVYGRSLIAVGQNRRAAERAGVPVARIIATTYLASGALAGLTGSLLAAYIAPSADLGTRYLLDSVAVVVIGGTLISGGRAVPVGVWGAALFFILLDGLVNLVGWSTAAQNLLKGGLVLLVLFLAGGGGRAADTPPLFRRRPRPAAATITTSGDDTHG
ncbi:ribose transport system permease protein [Streptosporangium becharense]|uniref:Ribose transport system permease protein n=1 Tax=Streptosporangium becharense TaxID=1816182 RepID=A0A7W9ILG1_9ACTN|nr:ABC transporter permease [Streptosporangium becharense]MBB2910134.1 ribose transport system permease protein [Streptosporangium becharense]MBB5822877.1 ribose transport system permease protein [Streptosporangium becharense]